MSQIAAWLRAARLPAQSNICVPLCLGLAFAKARGHHFGATEIVLVLAFGLFDQLTIVFANDAADHETDRRNKTATPFSGGSRVTVRGELSPQTLLAASRITAALTLLCAMALSLASATPWPLGLAVLGLGLLYGYSFGPRLSYRGGGEVLQVLGTGVVLPLYGFAGGAHTLADFPLAWLLPVLPLRFACAIATALPDEPSDRESDKRTLVVTLGNAKVRLLLVALSLSSVALVYRFGPGTPPVALVSVVSTFALLQLALGAARPGTRAMLLRVAVQIAATLAFELGVALWVLSR